MLGGKSPRSKHKRGGSRENPRGRDNKRNTCQTTGKNKTGGRGRDEKDKTIGRDEKCPLAKRPAKVLLFEHICNRKSGLQIQYVGHERKAKCPTFFMPNFLEYIRSKCSLRCPHFVGPG